MKKSLLAICLQQRFAIALTTAAISLAFSGVAKADDFRLNGIKLQGWHLNGIRFNGIKFQGTNMQATKLQGMEVQNLKVEGGQLVAVTRVAGDMQATMFVDPCRVYPYIGCKWRWRR